MTSEVNPPQYFSSATELREWLAGNDVSERSDVTVVEPLIDKALTLQEDALADGYIISVNMDEDPDYWYIGCSALIDGYIWIVDVETDEVVQWSIIGRIR